MLKIFLLFVTVFITFVSFSQEQNIIITGDFFPKDKAASHIAIYGNLNQKSILAESKVKDGKFTLTLPNNIPYGVYKFGFGMQEKPNLYFIHEKNVNTYKIEVKNANNQWVLNSTSGKEYSYLNNYYQQKEKLLEPLRTLYYFTQNYPLKQERIYKNNLKALRSKKKLFKEFREKAILNAPIFSKEIIEQNKLILHDVNWSATEIETNLTENLWSRIPLNDSVYYKKPYFLEKLEMVFGSIIDNGKGTEKEKFKEITTKLNTLITLLKDNENKTKYYNLMIRFFANKQYPYVLNTIDAHINPNKLLTNNDSLAFVYRQEQKGLIGKKVPKILSDKNLDILNNIDSEEIVLVLVSGNTTFSLESLQHLEKELESINNTKVISIILGATSESLQNFNSIFPNWINNSQSDQVKIQKIVSDYKLVYTPTVFVLDKRRTITRIVHPFDQFIDRK